MATVYLARDIRHDRHVALKLLNPELGAVLGVERFLAEIRVTANLQHPNLLPLFDSGATDGLLFYVMPYVEGESLRARLEREKQLPIDEALRITVAIATALDYAHSHGVIHRDLKPENILLQAGQPVIADFGIALAVSKAGGSRITQTGLSLGTPQYMSPEQATGDRVIDGRSDIYSLGAVAYEMLTGDPPHTGSTSQAIIARMLTEKPRTMRSSRAAIPEHVELAVQHALGKLPADRFSNAREFAEALAGRGPALTTGYSASDRASGGAATSWKRRLLDPVTLGFAALAVAAIAFAALRKPATPPDRVVRFVLSTPDTLRPISNYPWPAAISLDGNTVVYAATGRAGTMFYSVRTDQLEARPIPGTLNAFQPHFSPDGEWFVFETAGALKKVRLDGSAPITIAAGAGGANGADWTTRDEIVLGAEGTKFGLSKVSASGGEFVEFVKPDKSKGETHYLWPIALPDGKAVVFSVWTGSLATARLASVSVEGGDVAYLGIKGIRPLAVIDGKLVYVQADGAVMAVSLDRGGREVRGPPVSVLDPVQVAPGNNGNSGIFVSHDGALVTSRGGTRSQIAWISREGTTTPVTKDAQLFNSPRLSPDGRRIAVVSGDQDNRDIWTYDLETGTFARLSSVTAAASPVWSPDGSRVFFIGLGGAERLAIWSQRADGGADPEKVLSINGQATAIALAPDGRSLLYQGYTDNNWNIFRVQLDSSRVVTPFLSTPANESSVSFSPDGRWVAVATDESGQGEVYVRSYPNPSLSKVQISTGGGSEPAWSADGTRLYYLASGNVGLAAKLSMSPSVRVIARDTVLRETGGLIPTGLTTEYDVAKDGRVLGLALKKDDYQLVVVPNWRAELAQRLAARTRR
jgi:serine/threonine-protein kinase